MKNIKPNIENIKKRKLEIQGQLQTLLPSDYHFTDSETISESHPTKQISKLLKWAKKYLNISVEPTKSGVKLCPPEEYSSECYMMHMHDKAIFEVFRFIAKAYGTTKQNVEAAFNAKKGLQLNENSIHNEVIYLNESTDREQYEDVVFMQGDEAQEVLDMIEQEGPEAALEHLKQWHEPGNQMGRDEIGNGTHDQTFEKDGYIMSWNNNIGYVGLTYDFHNENIQTEDHDEYLDAISNDYGAKDAAIQDIGDDYYSLYDQGDEENFSAGVSNADDVDFDSEEMAMAQSSNIDNLYKMDKLNNIKKRKIAALNELKRLSQ